MANQIVIEVSKTVTPSERLEGAWNTTTVCMQYSTTCLILNVDGPLFWFQFSMFCHLKYPPRAQYETLIRRCFVQLTEGCGNSECTNPNCATGSGCTMDQNQAAAKALTLVHKTKKFQICVPQDRVTSSSSSNTGKKSLLNTLAVVPSQSGSSSLDSKDESFVNLSSTHTEPMETAEPMEAMETTDSLVTANTNKTDSTGSAASSTIIQMQSGGSAENAPSLHNSTRQLVRIPSDIEPASSSEGTESLDTSTGVLSMHSSNQVVAAHMPSISTISSSEIVGMDLSPSVPSGPSFSLPQPKPELDGSAALPIPTLPDIAPGENLHQLFDVVCFPPPYSAAPQLLICEILITDIFIKF